MYLHHMEVSFFLSIYFPYIHLQVWTKDVEIVTMC